MRNTLIATLVAAAFGLYAGNAFPQANMSGAVGTAPGQAKAVTVVTAKAKVTAVDPATRSVTLQMDNGKTRTISVGDEVRNFDKIHVGDTVHAKYVESLSIELKKDGKTVLGQTQRSAMERAQPGEKPGGVAIHEVTVTAAVVNVDPAKKLVSVKNDKGEVFELGVRDPEQLKLVKVGDQVQATYTEAVAIGLEPAGK